MLYDVVAERLRGSLQYSQARPERGTGRLRAMMYVERGEIELQQDINEVRSAGAQVI